MKIDGVIVCVDYADFLAHTLPFNRNVFDKLVVVTTPEDRQTRDLCEHYNIECLTTNCFTSDAAKFAKSRGINMGLAHLASEEWVVQLDADLVLPPRTRELLTKLERADALNPEAIYGIDRVMCPSFAAWIAWLSKPQVQHSCNTFIQMDRFPTGTRIGRLRVDGWLPIGFFQMWNPKIAGAFYYPEGNSAEGSDYIFAMRWPRAKRVFIPEIVGIHLDSTLRMGTAAGRGANWEGRKTPFFGPE